MAAESQSSLVTAVRGERREALEALRDHLAATLQDAPPTAVAPITKQLQDVLQQLDELGGAKGDAVDDLAARRAARRSAAAG